jgi:uracil-DNA glycosylase
VSDDGNDDLERRSLIRGVRQELESLGRAGLDRIPAWKPPSPPAPAPIAPKPPTPSLPREQSSRVPHAPLPAPAPLLGAREFETPMVPLCDRQSILNSLAATVAVCQKCPHLAATRTQTVFGVGSNEARLMFVGEAPGADEDRIGKPFVGRAGQLLTDMITKGMGLSRDQVYIANVLKCRPPDNRTPTPEEVSNCRGYLEEQIAVVRPEFLCLLGGTAASTLLESTLAVGKLRRKWHDYRGIRTLVTYHPSYLLRMPSAKKDAWEDLQMLMKEMGLKVPARGTT